MRIFIFAMMFVLMASPAFALKVIDAQQETHCVDGYCKTVVDLTKYMNISKISEVESKTISKAYNMSKTLTSSKDMLVYELKEGAKIEKSSHNLFSYKYEKNIMTFEGYVKENVYWNFDLGNGYVIDPWWNSTGNTSSFIQFTQGWTFQGANPDFGGVVITALRNSSITTIERGSGVDATYGYVYNSTGGLLGKVGFIGDVATFSPAVALVQGQTYYVGVGADGVSYASKSINPYSFPVASADINATAGAYSSWTGSAYSTFNSDSIMRNMLRINTSYSPLQYNIFYNTYSNNNISDAPTVFSLNVDSTTYLSGYIFSTNNTGSWVNDTWTPFSSVWANVTKTLNSTVGTLVQFVFYTNDTIGRWNTTGIQNITTIGNIQINAYDEQTQAALMFNVTAYNSTTSVTYLNRNNTFQTTGLLGNVTFQITSTGYGQRLYSAFISQSSITTVNAYLLDSTVGESIIFFVKNNYEQPLEGVTLNVSKFINGVWTLVAQGTTDSIGSTTQFLNQQDVYKFEFFYQNVTKTLSLLPTLTTYYVYFSSGTVPIPSYWDYYSNFAGSCGFANSTRILTCVWNSTMAISNVTLNVISRNATAESTLCLNVSNATNGTLACSFGAPANKTFMWSANVQIGSEKYLFASGTWTDSRPAVNLGYNGLIVCFIIVLAAGFVGVQTGNPILIVLLSSIGVAVSILMGFLNLGESALTIVMSLFVSASVLMYKMRSGSA